MIFQSTISISIALEPISTINNLSITIETRNFYRLERAKNPLVICVWISHHVTQLAHCLAKISVLCVVFFYASKRQTTGCARSFLLLRFSQVSAQDAIFFVWPSAIKKKLNREKPRKKLRGTHRYAWLICAFLVVGWWKMSNLTNRLCRSNIKSKGKRPTKKLVTYCQSWQADIYRCVHSISAD